MRQDRLFCLISNQKEVRHAVGNREKGEEGSFVGRMGKVGGRSDLNGDSDQKEGPLRQR